RAPRGGAQRLRAWEPVAGVFAGVGRLTEGNWHGREVVPARIVVASQVDSLLSIFDGQASLPVVRVPGARADIGYDTQRNRVAVPYIALDRVDIWELRQPE